MPEEITALIRSKVSEALDAIGKVTVEGIQRDLSTPYPPSGPAGIGPPARRTGQLQQGVIHYQEQTTTEVVEYIHSTRPPERKWDDPETPQHLEFGTSQAAPRPYMTPARDRLAATITDDVASRIS